MASAQPSQDMLRGRDREPPSLGRIRLRHRSESRRLSDQRRPAPHPGNTIWVFSRSAQKWLHGKIMNFMGGDFVRVEYDLGEYWCGKTLHLQSEHLVLPNDFNTSEADPGVNFSDEPDVRAALQDVWIQFHREGISKIDLALKNQGGLELYQNNSFYTREPLGCPCNISYHGPDNDDILIKVYILDAEQHNCNQWDKYTLVGHMHAKVKRDSVAIQNNNPYFLGLMLHKDLNDDQLWKLPPEEMEQKLRRSPPGGYGVRGEVLGEQRAQDAHYLLSRATADTADNNKLLNYLTTHPVKGPHCEEGGPMKFCTDRSLGFGKHFTKENNVVLYLAKHGFGQPVGIEWFKQYEQASKQTRHGVLILQLSIAYLRSMACRKELGKLTQERLFVHIGGSIVSWSQMKQDSELLLEALNNASDGDVRLPPVVQLGCICQELLGFDTDWKLLERVLANLALKSGRERSDPHTFLLFCDLIYHFNIHVYGERHLYTAAALNCLACCHGAIGNYENMKEMQQNALEIQEGLDNRPPWADMWTGFGPLDRPWTSATALMLHLCSLAKAHAFLGDYRSVKQVALLAYQKPCPKYEAYYRGRILKLLSDAHGFLGELQLKEQVLHEAIRFLERHLKEFKEWVDETATSVDRVNWVLGRRVATEYMDDFMPPGLEAHICNVLVLLGNAHGELGHTAEKKDFLSNALEMIERKLGENHFRVGNVLGNLARACREVGEFTHEKEMLERMLSVYRSHYGDEHVMTERVQRALDGEQDIMWPDEDDVISPGWWFASMWSWACPPPEVFSTDHHSQM